MRTSRVRQERMRLVSELEAARASAASAEMSLSSEHESVLSGLRGELDAMRVELRGKESAGLAAADTVAELRQKLIDQAEAGSSVTALHAQLRTVSSELESVKYQQATENAHETASLFYQKFDGSLACILLRLNLH